MNDDQLEALLRRVRPAGPRHQLRARILDAARPVGRAWAWWLAAAATLALVIQGHVMADRLQGRIAAVVAPAAPIGAGDLAALRDAVAGNEELLGAAAAWTAEERRQQRRAAR